MTSPKDASISTQTTNSPHADGVVSNPWQELRRYTAARIALGRSGVSLPTDALLQFGLAHAQARDAVHQPLEVAQLAARLQSLGLQTLQVHSRAASRDLYLRRPDLGRQLADESRHALQGAEPQGQDLLIMVADGLSSKALHHHALPFIEALLPHLRRLGLSLAPIVLAQQGRVALGDEVGEALNARAVLLLIGERPGLSSPDSLGLYLTWQPRAGRLDSERNCISNVRPEGLDYPQAAHKQAWLLEQAFCRRLTGVELKDESDAPLLISAEPVSAAISDAAFS
ncbi:MAG: ethanolamine ammonia-lyase subunit EutC [Aeromonadaceae bacterium]